jgi:hypothetical protein
VNELGKLVRAVVAKNVVDSGNVGTLGKAVVGKQVAQSGPAGKVIVANRVIKNAKKK